MNAVLLVVFGFFLLVLQTAVAMLLPMYSYAPNLLLPIAIFLGVSPEVPMARGTAVGFALGYLLDSFSGSPMGLHTFVMTASFMVARGAGLRLFPQGPAFQILLSFLMAFAFGATLLALRAIFERPTLAIGETSLRETALSLVQPAIATAVVSPLVFVGVRRIETLGQKRREATR
jgi:rod shape-determining protein MreD